MNRQFTDGEIVAAIKAIAADGTPLSRTTVRRRLGGGGSNRISALLKEYYAGAHGAPQGIGSLTASTAVPANTDGAEALADAPTPAVASPLTMVDSEGESNLAQLQSEIRVLKILLESERNARHEDEARYVRTIEALQREIEIATRGLTNRTAGRAAQRSGTLETSKLRPKTVS